MKRLILALALLLWAGGAWAADSKWQRSDLLTADAAVFSGRAVIHGILGSTGGTNDLTLEVHDGSSTGGDEVIPSMVISGSDNFGGFIGLNVVVTEGIYVNYTSAGGGEYIVYYTRD